LGFSLLLALRFLDPSSYSSLIIEENAQRPDFHPKVAQCLEARFRPKFMTLDGQISYELGQGLLDPLL
jgi:hypothetical protein